MTKRTTTGLLVNGSIKTAGVSFYTRNGKTVVRSATSTQPRSNTRGQFDARQRMKHTTALWGEMKKASPMFEGGNSVYGRFCTLANALPTVYTPKSGSMFDASFLMPGMPVSDGLLPPVEQQLGEVDGQPALLLNLTSRDICGKRELRLYTVRQDVKKDTAYVRISKRRLQRSDFVEVDGHLALVGPEFGDDMTGWAVVNIFDNHCSSQTIVTRCRYYEPYTTEEAMRAAATTYGGLTTWK